MGVTYGVLIILGLVLIICLFRKSKIVSKEFFEGDIYKNFTNNNKNLDNILQSFSKLSHTSGGELKNIAKSYLVTKSNLDNTLKQELESVIGEVLTKINKMYETEYKLTDIERVKVESNILKERQVTVIFFIYELDKYSTRKVLMQYRISDRETNLSHIRTVQSGNNDFNQTYISSDYHELNNGDIVDDKLSLLQSQDKCTDNLKLYTGSEHKEINLKLDDNCIIKDLPKHMSRPFVNPTMFALF